MVSLFLMLRTLLLTSHCIGSFQWPTVPRHGAGWLLDARRGEDLRLRTNIRLFYILSARVYLLFCETTYLSEHRSSPECHIMHTFVPKELFFRLVNDFLSWNATGNWPKYSQRPFGHSAMYSPMWSPEALSRILASVIGGSSLIVRKSGHKQCSPWKLYRARYSSHISGVTRLLPSTGLASSSKPTR